jgi:hypothetical protein
LWSLTGVSPLTNTQSFRSAEGERPKKYSQFVQAGTGNTSIWDDLQAQSLLGVEGFAEGLRHLVTEKQQIREIAKGQRFVGRPSLEKLFSQRSRGKASRDRCHQAPYRRIQMPARQIPDPYRSLFLFSTSAPKYVLAFPCLQTSNVYQLGLLSLSLLSSCLLSPNQASLLSTSYPKEYKWCEAVV